MSNAPNNRRQLIVIMVISMISLGASYGLFYLASVDGGWGTTNNGEFVTPSVTTEDIGWQPIEEPGRFWWLWVVTEDGCDANCPQMVADLRALHILLNRETSRVRRGITSINGSPIDLPEPFPKLIRIQANTPELVGPGVYIIDPNNNFVFRYSIDVNPKLILQDLKKLLKVSQIG